MVHRVIILSLVLRSRCNPDTERVEVVLQGWAKRTLETDYIVLASTHIDPKVEVARESGLEIDQVHRYTGRQKDHRMDIYLHIFGMDISSQIIIEPRHGPQLMYPILFGSEMVVSNGFVSPDLMWPVPPKKDKIFIGERLTALK